MPDTAQINLSLRGDVIEKLAELAGGESCIGEYLTCLILKLHAKKCGQGGVVDLEQAILEINELLENEQSYKREIRSLEQNLTRALAPRRRLPATRGVNQWQVQRINAVLH
jgi:hypothetical protein